MQTVDINVVHSCLKLKPSALASNLAERERESPKGVLIDGRTEQLSLHFSNSKQILKKRERGRERERGMSRDRRMLRTNGAND